VIHIKNVATDRVVATVLHSHHATQHHIHDRAQLKKRWRPPKALVRFWGSVGQGMVPTLLIKNSMDAGLGVQHIFRDIQFEDN
jgi:hypothetical protein